MISLAVSGLVSLLTKALGGRGLSYLLVVAQFASIYLLATPVSALLHPRGTSGAFGAGALFASLALAGAALLAMRPSRFSVLPEPREGSVLIERGPYARIRHPMYAAVLLGGLGAALVHGAPLDWLLLALLAGVLLIKLRHEERLLVRRFPAYADYRRRTSALLPGLY